MKLNSRAFKEATVSDGFLVPVVNLDGCSMMNRLSKG